MPVADHPSVPTPPEHVTIWRFMDFPKFVSIVAEESLWLARGDQLGDRFEGSLPRRDSDIRASRIETFEPETRKWLRDRLPEMIAQEQWMRRTDLVWTYVNSWHVSEHESAALWDLHSPKSGIAVQSTYARLRDSIRTSKTMYIGEVRYLDFEEDSIADPARPKNAPDVLTVFLHKRKSFEHERELRILRHTFPSEAADPTGRIPPEVMEGGGPSGIAVPVDLKGLVAEVRMHPDTPSWTFSLARRLVADYGHEFDVVRSDLARNPLY